MYTTTFYHYLPSGGFASDRLDGVDPEYQPKHGTRRMATETLYHLENISDIFIASEEEEDELLATTKAM